MLPSELLDLFRVEMSDTKKPYLWSDDFITGAIDHSQKQYARLTDGLPDSTSAATVLQLTAGLDAYALSPLVLKVRSVRHGATGRPLEVINEEDMPGRGMYFDGRPGMPRALITGMDADMVRVWPVPAEDETVNLSVFRLPLVAITDDEPLEIPRQHHRELLLWVKHLAYSVHDAETYDKTKAVEFEEKFRSFCFKVMTEQARARHKPRAVVYGGI